MKRLWTLLLLLSCTPNFQNASDLVDLRVLAAQAEPAEAQFDQSGADDVQVRVLAVDPLRPTNFAVLKWQICQTTSSLRCDGFQVFLQGQVTRNSGDEFPPVTVSIPPEVVKLVVGNDKLGDFGGIRAQFSFSVDDGDPAGPAYGAKVLVYSPRGKSTPNHNPEMTGVQLTKKGVAAGPPVAAGATMCLPADVQYGLRPVLAPDARETYTTTDLKNNVITLTEDPSYSFFTAPGASVDRDGAIEPADGKAPPDGLARIEASTLKGSTFYVVVRDGRGGESWISFPVSVPGGPNPCAPVDARGRPDRP